jgi:acyl-CoA reductase-like NAD-dependent aldehyde dehydrogenase
VKIGMVQASQKVTPVILELGKKNQYIVDPAANIEIAVSRIVF